MKKVLLVIFIGLLPILGISQTANCKYIEKTVDEFTGEIDFRVDVGSLESGNLVSFIKTKKNEVITYRVSIHIKSSDIYTGKGFYIILQNGEKILKPDQEVSTKLIGDTFYIRKLVRLTDEDIALLKESGIKKFKLYIITGELSDKDAEKSKELFNCLVVVE